MLLGAGGTLLSSMALVLIAQGLSASYAGLARAEVDDLIERDLDHISTGVYNLVAAESGAFAGELDTSMRVAQAFLKRSGGASPLPKVERWEAVNQHDGSAATVDLPRLAVGGAWQGRSATFDSSSPFVDDLSGLLNVTVTLFQRMNERGDMLRVATTVPAGNGERAVGTYLPAFLADGSPNEVLAAILRGEGYRGRSVVMNDWYLTAYEPLYSVSSPGELIGMLYVGKRQADIEARIRSAIVQTRIGATG